VSEFKHCLTDRNPKTMRKQLFGDDASKTLHPRAPPKANRRRLAAQPATSDADARPQLNTSRSSEGSGGNGPGLLHADPARLALCKQREDLNRDAAINKCYSGPWCSAPTRPSWRSGWRTSRAGSCSRCRWRGWTKPRGLGSAGCTPFWASGRPARWGLAFYAVRCLHFIYFFQTLRLTLRLTLRVFIYCSRLTCLLS